MVVYRTSDVEEKAQFAYWHDVICEHFVPADSKLESRNAFDARFQTSPLGEIQISRLSAPPHFWSRNSNHLRAAPHEEFLLGLMVSGDGCLGQGGREVRQKPDEMVLYDTGRPFSYYLASDIILLKIPRRHLLARVPQASRLTASAFGKRSPVGALASGLIRQSQELDLSSNALAAEKLGSSVLDAVAAAMEWELSGQGSSCSKQTLLLNRIKSYVLANLENRNLSAETIAQKHGISSRTLTRLFAVEGMTPMRWTWQQRLEACRGLLAGAQTEHVTDAFNFGFSDLSHFCRAFKIAYGVSPGSLMKERRSAHR